MLKSLRRDDGRRRKISLRQFVVLWHRYVGLFLAGFLFVIALTGSVIAFYQEVDQWLNPQWFKVDVQGERLSASQWVAQAETRRPEIYVSYIAFPRHAQGAVALSVAPRQEEVALDYNEIFIDPYTGDLLGQRDWGAFRCDRGHLIPFIYQLHYSMHLGEWGIWMLGVISLIWFFDCFAGMYLAWPKATWRAIKQALTVKWRARPVRVNYDLHRAGGIWFWMVLAVLAFSGVAMNLHDEVFEPVVNWVSPLSPWPPHSIKPKPESAKQVLPISVDQAIASAEVYLQNKSIAAEIGAVVIRPSKGLYQVRFRSDINIMKDHPEMRIFVDRQTGEVLSHYMPGFDSGTAGDVLSRWQYPLHSGKAFGLTGRIIICLTGLVTAMLSVTGVYLWWKKRRGRVARCRKTLWS